MNRRSAPKVRGGRVQKKNNWAPTHQPDEIRLERRDPAYGCRHLITIAQLREFIELLPDWDEIALGLEAIVLDSDDDSMGWHLPGIVAICAWEQDLWWDETKPEWLVEHAHVLDLLGVERRGKAVCWTEPQARAFQLLHVLPHELGHHRDRMTTRSKWTAARGEPYAEAYANRALELLWPQYAAHFEI